MDGVSLLIIVVMVDIFDYTNGIEICLVQGVGWIPDCGFLLLYGILYICAGGGTLYAWSYGYGHVGSVRNVLCNVPRAFIITVIAIPNTVTRT